MNSVYDLNKETIFQPTGRTSVIPFDTKYSDIVKLWDIQKSSYWTKEKIHFSDDLSNYVRIPPEIRACTESVLGYFAISDEIIEQIISQSCLRLITIPEIQSIYAYESMMEKEHSMVYNLNIEALITDLSRREELFHAVEHMPMIALKADNARRYITDTRHPGYTIVGKAGNEGINFSSSFAWIDWLKSENYNLPGTFLANFEISRDEARHVDTSCLVYRHLDHKLTPDNVAEVLDECERVEILFVDEVMPKTHMNGMSASDMKRHVRHAKAHVAAGLGYPELYPGTQSPFADSKRGLQTKTNFFESDSAEYTRLDAAEGIDGFDSADADF